MAKVTLPNNWKPRPYQLKAWNYLENGGKHAELIWHRRSGKDEVALHRTACAAFERVATYWHMLPLATQIRKAIWEAVNPHTGKRRIDEAFPHEIRESTNATEMFIRFKNGSTWQAVGSDNFNNLVGSPPAGIVYSEWALANPAARAILRPILKENNGWQLFISTPRGNNHAKKTYEAAIDRPGSFAQKLTVADTGAMTPEERAEELKQYIADFGMDQGEALYLQEYMCDFDAAVLGAYYGGEIRKAEEEGRITEVAYDPALPVHTAWDVGFSDDTCVWFYQMHRNEIHVIDYYAANGYGVDHYADMLNRKGYGYVKAGSKPMLMLPHDARAKTFAAAGKSVQQQFEDLGYTSRIVPELSVQDGIQAARLTLRQCYFDRDKCADGIEALKLYRREWDDDKRMFRDKPLHDWTSHAADSFRYLSIAWREQVQSTEKPKPRFDTDMTVAELIKRQRQKRLQDE